MKARGLLMVAVGVVLVVGYATARSEYETAVSDAHTSEDAAMLKGLRTVVYHVDNLKEAKGWYSRALQQTPYFDEPFYVGFEVGGFELGLHPGETDAEPNPGRVYAYWGVEDVDNALNHLFELGATEHEPVQDVGGGVRLATVVDPFGNILGIIENPNFKPEAVR